MIWVYPYFWKHPYESGNDLSKKFDPLIKLFFQDDVPAFLWYMITLHKANISNTLGKGKSSTQKFLARIYVSSQQGMSVNKVPQNLWVLLKITLRSLFVAIVFVATS